MIQERLEIIGIGFMLTLDGRFKNDKEEAPIFDFIKNFPLKMKHKKNLIFCILSLYDKYFDEEDEIKFK